MDERPMNATKIYEKYIHELEEQNKQFSNSIEQINAEQLRTHNEDNEVVNAEKSRFRNAIINNQTKIAKFQAMIKALKNSQSAQEIAGVNF